MMLLTGAMGYIGNLVRCHFERRRELIRLDVRGAESSGILRCDLADPKAVHALARRVRPDVIVHAAGIKDIGFCERNPGEAFRANADGLVNLARAFGERSRIVYVSSDHVFRGDRGGYREDDTPAPVTVYGKSVLRAETEGHRLAGRNFIVLRASAVFDLDATFPRYLLERFAAGLPADCFTDAVYSPVYFRDFLSLLDAVTVDPDAGGDTFHACGDAVTRHGFAMALADAFGFDAGLVVPCAREGRTPFLFSDLSLRNERTRERLGAVTTPLHRALRELRAGLLNGAPVPTARVGGAGGESSRLGVVIPLANEEETVEELLHRVLAQLTERDTVFCIIDRKSTDRTFDLVRQAAADRRVVAVWAPESRSVADAYMRGYREALASGCQWILEMDGGLSHLPEEIPRFREAGRQGVDFAAGSRFVPGGSHEGRWSRRLVSLGGTKLVNRLLDTRMRDMTSGFQFFSRRALAHIVARGVRSRAHFFQTEVRYLLRDWNWVEVPIRYSNPSKSLTVASLLEAAGILFRLAWEARFPRQAPPGGPPDGTA